MYTKLTDFDKVTPNNRIAELTNVSNGTLMTITKECGFFEVTGVSAGIIQRDHLDSIRKAWKLFTAFKLEQGESIQSWVDCWDEFTTYIAEQCLDLFKAAVAEIDSIGEPTRITPRIGIYDAFDAPKGEFQLHYNGVITRIDGLNTHAVVAMLEGKDGLKDLFC